jgi:hypothetical protein
MEKKDNNLDVDFKGIKCDTVGCGYKDDSVTFNQYKDYVGRPCPKCGANLLTVKDYKFCKRIVGFAKFINKLPFPKSEDRYSATIDFDGKNDPVIRDFKKIS